MLQYYAMERFLYRLSVSSFADRFILKGALLLRVWQAPLARPTMDIDMLGRTANAPENITTIIHHVLAVEEQEDGIIFDPDSIAVEPITEDADYEGLRVRFRGHLDAARLTIQLDIGFGDKVYPDPVQELLPSLLNFPPAEMYCYSRESMIAEKFEVMAKLGILNSRMKDFYDIWMLSRQYNFECSRLAEAIKQTFEQRGTKLVQPQKIFSRKFIGEKQVQWTAFRKRIGLEFLPEDFNQVVQQLELFLSPVVKGLTEKGTHGDGWIAPDGDRVVFE
jgi:predicted nucleotidyltransferase component of viral defense system